MLALESPADASLCHAPERPTFGMDDAPIGPGRSVASDPALIVPASPHYEDAPCPGESAGFPSKLPVPRALLSSSIRVEPTDSQRPRRPEASFARPPLADARPLERPPRDLSVLVPS